MSSELVLADAAVAAAALVEGARSQIAGEVAQLVSLVRLAELYRVDADHADNAAERLVRGGHDGTPLVSEFLALEVGPLLHISPRAASIRIAQALDLRYRHPRLWQAVITGSIRVWQATHVAVATSGLSAEGAAWVDTQCAIACALQPWGRVLRALPGWVTAADPAVAAERARLQREARQVRVGKITEGAIPVWGVLDAADGIALDTALDHLADRLAADGDTGTHEQHRATALGILARGGQFQLPADGPAADVDRSERTCQGDVASDVDGAGPAINDVDGAGPAINRVDGAGPVLSDLDRTMDGDSDEPAGYAYLLDPTIDPVTPPRVTVTATVVVHLTADTFTTGHGAARVEGWGPLDHESLQRFLTGCRKVTVRPVIDLNGITPVDSYEIPDRMRFALRQRNPVDTFPWSTTTSDRCDLDHTIPYRWRGSPGQTAMENLGPASRTPHRAKTLRHWHLEQPQPGHFRWTSPLGYRYDVTPDGSTRIDGPSARGTPLPARDPRWPERGPWPERPSHQHILELAALEELDDHELQRLWKAA